MKKQILAVMVGLTVILGGCSKQSSQNTESTDSNQNIENMLQEVKKDTKEAKSGKVTISLLIDDEKDNPSRSSGYERSGDEKLEKRKMSFILKIVLTILRLVKVIKLFGLNRNYQKIPQMVLTLRKNH